MSDVQVSDQEFRRALKRYQQLSGKTFAQIANSKLFFIFKAAKEKTAGHQATKADIERVYGPRLRYSKKTGRLSKRSRQQNPLALYIHHLKKSGEKIPPSRRELIEQAKKWQAQRYRAIGYQQAGFNDGMRKFARAARLQTKVSRGPRNKRQKSLGFPARAKGSVNKRLTALAVYRLQQGWGGGVGQIDRRTDRAISGAVQAEMRSTVDHVANKELDRLKRKVDL
tara:strand:- start:389 stop:1063 length:675 start_codon:yes stop_codon:yes gene_type:complete